MVKSALVAALVVTLVGSGAVRVEPKPPVISEAFTPLPCPAEPKSTVDLISCAERKILKTNQAINKRVSVIFFLLRERRSAAAVSRFVRSERAWLNARRGVCRSRADVYEGGSAAPLTFVVCEVRANALHLRDLKAFDRALRN